MEGSLVNESSKGIDHTNTEAVPSQRGASPSASSDLHEFTLFFQEGYSGVLENILKCLNVEEMKTLSSTSRGALDAVCHSKCFSDMIQFRISKKTVESGLLENCSFPFKRLFMRIFDDGVLETNRSLEFLGSVRSLEIQVLPDFIDLKGLSKILIRTKSLRELNIPTKALKYLLEEGTSTPDLTQLLRNLDRLELCCDDCDWEDCDESLIPKLNLRTLSADYFVDGNLSKVVLKMVEQSKAILETLQFHGRKFSGYGWSLIHCPKLRVVNITGMKFECVGEVEMFLSKQPPLEKIKVETDSPSRLLTALQGKLSKLRKLHIDVLGWNPKDESMPQNVDWRGIVESMKTLEALLVEGDEYSKSALMDAENILCWLPTAKLRKLCIWGTGDADICLNQNVGDHISRFQNLTELKLNRLPLLNDARLQGIITGCPKLLHLTLYKLPKASSFGISGVVRAKKVGVSLNDLKDLVTLGIRDCGNLTLDSILDVLRLNSLRSFYLEHEAPHSQFQVPDWLIDTPEDIVIRILEQNPNLRQLRFLVWNYFEEAVQDTVLEMKVKKIYPRIEEVIICHDYVGPDNQDLDSGTGYFNLLFGSNNEEDSGISGD